jgi:hypothetical protein
MRQLGDRAIFGELREMRGSLSAHIAHFSQQHALSFLSYHIIRRIFLGIPKVRTDDEKIVE